MARPAKRLPKAERYGWSRQDLRDRLRGRSELEAPKHELAIVRVTVERERAQSWARAAEVAEVKLNEWICTILDEAALSASCVAR